MREEFLILIEELKTGLRNGRVRLGTGRSCKRVMWGFFQTGTTEPRRLHSAASRQAPGAPVAREQAGEGVTSDSDDLCDTSRVSPPRLADRLDSHISCGVSVVLASRQWPSRDDLHLQVTSLPSSQRRQSCRSKPSLAGYDSGLVSLLTALVSFGSLWEELGGQLAVGKIPDYKIVDRAGRELSHALAALEGVCGETGPTRSVSELVCAMRNPDVSVRRLVRIYALIAPDVEQALAEWMNLLVQSAREKTVLSGSPPSEGRVSSQHSS